MRALIRMKDGTVKEAEVRAPPPFHLHLMGEVDLTKPPGPTTITTWLVEVDELNNIAHYREE